MIWSIIGGYLGIGLIVWAGPRRREVRDQIEEVHASDPGLRESLGQESLPAWKLAAFRTVLVVALVAVWPLFLVAWIGDRSSERREQREREARLARGLEYSRMGGAGVIACGDCGYREEIVSFTHGLTSGPDASCTEGRQCLECGKFHSVYRTGNPPSEPVPRCACGGELSREHVLFCPNCRSRELRYRLSYIT